MPFFREKIYIYLILILFACVSCTTTSSLDLAIKYRNWQWIEHHVEKEGNIEKRNIHSLTPLMTAAYYGDHMVAEYLCRHNANVNAQDRNGYTALMYAADYGFGEVIKILLRYGADQRIRNNDGNSARIIAERHGNWFIVGLLDGHHIDDAAVTSRALEHVKGLPLKTTGAAGTKPALTGEDVSSSSGAPSRQSPTNTSGASQLIENLIELGEKQSERGEWDGAISTFSKALELDPTLQELYVERGLAWFNKDNYDQAISDFNKAVELDPEDNRAYLARGYCWNLKKKYTKADKDISKAIELDPTKGIYYYYKGLNWYDFGDIELAMESYSKGISFDPQYALSYFRRGKIYYERGDYERAHSDFRKYNNLEPDDADFSKTIAWYLATCPDPSYRSGKIAVQQAKKAVTLERSHETLNVLAAAYAQAGQFDLAVRTQQKAYSIQKFPKYKTLIDVYRQKQTYLDYERGKPFLSLDTGGHLSWITDVLFTNDGKFLVSASTDKTIRVWDPATGNTVRVIRGHSLKDDMIGRIFATALSPDDTILATGGPFKNFGIRLIEFQSGKMNTILNGHTDIVTDLAFGPAGRILISGSRDKTARVWDVQNKKTLYVLKGHQGKVSAVTISDSGAFAATGSDDASVRLWNTKTGELIDTLKGHKSRISSVSFTPDGKYLLSGSNDTTIRLWDGKTGRFIKVLSKVKNGVTYFSISPDGKKLVTGIGPKGMLSDRVSHVISIPGGQKIASFNKHNSTVISVDISKDGKTVASAGGDKNEIYIWNLDTGRVKNKLVGNGDSIFSVGFSKDGRFIAWGKKNAGFDIMKLGELKQSFRLKDDESNISLEIGSKIRSNDGFYGALKVSGHWKIQQIAYNPYKEFSILKNGNEAHRIIRNPKTEEPHTCMTLTPDGRYVISGGHDGTLIAYHLKTGKISHKFYGHPETVWSVSASPDSRLLVSGSSDNTIKLWEISTGKLLLTIFQGADDEWVAWISDGNYISSPRGDKYVGWHINNGPDKSADFYSAYQFERVFYRPDHVDDYLANYRMFEKFEALTGIETSKVRNIPKVKPPKIDIISPEYGKTFSGNGKIPLKLSVNSDSIDMNDYSVYVNNIPVTPSFERTLRGSEKRSFVRQLNIPLFNNINKIRVEIFNGYTMGLSETVVYRKGNVEAAKKGNLYLLSIGVNQFPKMPGNNLEFAAADANSLDAYYRKKGKRYFKNIITKSISDVSETKPSKDKILNSLSFIKKATAEDTVIIFLASHGLSDRAGNYYFIPRDATVEDIKELINGSPEKKSENSKGLDSLISWEEFFEALRSVPGKRLLIVDTCQAKNIEGTLDFHSLAKRSAASSFALLAASKGDEESQEYPKGKHGLFTYALLKGLSGKGDVNKDGQVDLSELYSFIGSFVEKNRDKSIGKQTPQLTAPKELQRMVLSSN